MRTITAFYDSVADAEVAASVLADGGFDRSSIQIVNQSRSTSAGATATRDDDGGGFFSALRGLFVPDEDRYTYEEGLRRGGALLTLRVEGNESDRAIELLDRTGAVDLDSRESEWRAEGWRGYEPGASDSTAATSDLSGRTVGGTLGGTSSDSLAMTGAEGSAGAARTGMTAAGASNLTARSGDLSAGREEETIPIVEEQLRVGKRETTGGSVRIRSYIVETPVEEQVTLRDERVTLERRPVDRATDTLGADAFRERTVEVTEKSEEAVVDKTARVTEELVLRKELDERTETIAENIRRTEVEVEDDRAGRGIAGPSTTDRTRDRV